MHSSANRLYLIKVAPARERGLKSLTYPLQQYIGCRSREGAWIEIAQDWYWSMIMQVAPVRERGLKSRSNAGRFHPRAVAPVRERGLKSQQVPAIVSKESRSREGAWIEIHYYALKSLNWFVAPVRERGLKCGVRLRVNVSTSRRSREGAWIEISEIQLPLDCVLRSLS